MLCGPVVSISVVVPVYSGEDYLLELVAQLDEVRKDWETSCAPMRIKEAILVDDAAIDGSSILIDELAAKYNWVSSLHLMRNFGQHSATVAGVLHTSGDWVLTMDEDLQHPPKDIVTMLRRAAQTSADIIYAKPKSGVHQALTRDFASRMFKRAMVLLTGNKNVSSFNSFRLIRGSLARAASSICGHDTYFDVALSWFTNRVECVPLQLTDQRYVQSKKSGYSFTRLLSHARRMLMSSQVKIIRLCSLLGLVVAGFSALGSIWLMMQKLLHPETIVVSGWASLMLVSLFFGGLIAFMIGIALEYLGALVLVAHGKPIFFVVDRTIDAKLANYFATGST